MTKKKSEKKPEISSFDIAMKAVAKQFGSVVKPMSDKPLVIDTISTRSIGLDAAMGRGGFALGRIYEVYGPNSAGKTTLAMSIIAEAQRRNMVAAFVDAEHAADPELFSSMGVDLEKLLVIDLFTGEDNLAVAETLMKSGGLDVLVIDSVSSLIPKVAADASYDDTTIALLARLMSKTLLRFSPIAAETNTCVIFINQLRMKIGVMFGNPETTTGGEAMGFYTTGRIRVSGVGVKANKIVSESGNLIGHKTFFDVVKNKLAPPAIKSSVDLIYGKGYDMVSEVITIATDIGVLTKSGSWYSYGGDNIGQGEKGVRKFFGENHDVFLIIKKDICDILGLTEYYEAQEARDARIASE